MELDKSSQKEVITEKIEDEEDQHDDNDTVSTEIRADPVKHTDETPLIDLHPESGAANGDVIRMSKDDADEHDDLDDVTVSTEIRTDPIEPADRTSLIDLDVIAKEASEEKDHRNDEIHTSQHLGMRANPTFETKRFSEEASHINTIGLPPTRTSGYSIILNNEIKSAYWLDREKELLDALNSEDPEAYKAMQLLRKRLAEADVLEGEAGMKRQAVIHERVKRNGRNYRRNGDALVREREDASKRHAEYREHESRPVEGHLDERRHYERGTHAHGYRNNSRRYGPSYYNNGHCPGAELAREGSRPVSHMGP